MPDMTPKPSDREALQPPFGYVMDWPAPGGGSELIFSRTDSAGRAIGCKVRPVYSEQQVRSMLDAARSLPAPGREPLTEAAIWFLTNDGMRNAAGGIYATKVIEFARAIESAHGITGGCNA